MDEIKINKLAKSGKIDMRGRVKKQSKLTDEEKKLNARLACKKFSENNKKAHNATYKKYYDKNKTEINKRRNEKKALYKTHHKKYYDKYVEMMHFMKQTILQYNDTNTQYRLLEVLTLS